MKRTYAGISQQYASFDFAKVVLLPVPYDGTSTWGKGADKGPEAFLDASENMELYDIETQTEVYKQGIYLADAISENQSPETMVSAVYQTTKKYIESGKLVSLFGGEHSISIGSIRAFGETFENLTVLQLDAHSDLRPNFHGTPYNHACAMFEASQKHNLVQIGIRSMDISEKQYEQKGNVFYAHQIHQDENWMDRALEQVTQNVYLTIDLDAFDPSIVPSTGTPEPGGLAWYTTLTFLKKLIKQKRIVGFDIVELAANEHDKSSDFLAAKLYYKILSYIFNK